MVHKHLRKIEEGLRRDEMMAGLMHSGDFPVSGIAYQNNAFLVVLAGLGEEVAQVGDAVAAERVLRHLALLGQNAEIAVDVAYHTGGEFHGGGSYAVMTLVQRHNLVLVHLPVTDRLEQKSVFCCLIINVFHNT